MPHPKRINIETFVCFCSRSVELQLCKMAFFYSCKYTLACRLPGHVKHYYVSWFIYQLTSSKKVLDSLYKLEPNTEPTGIINTCTKPNYKTKVDYISTKKWLIIKIKCNLKQSVVNWDNTANHHHPNFVSWKRYWSVSLVISANHHTSAAARSLQNS